MQNVDNYKSKNKMLSTGIIILAILALSAISYAFYSHKAPFSIASTARVNAMLTDFDLDKFLEAPKDEQQNFKELLEKVNRTILENPGDEVLFPIAEQMTEEYVNWRTSIDSISEEELEKSVYFYKQDFNRLFNTLNNQNCDPDKQAVRIYFAKYSDDLSIGTNNTPHPYAGRLSVILRATCGTSDLDYVNGTNGIIVNPSTDFGEICPPNCEPMGYTLRPGFSERKKGNNGPKNTSDGFFSETN